MVSLNILENIAENLLLDAWLDAEDDLQREADELNAFIPLAEGLLAESNDAEERREIIILLGQALERQVIVETSLEFITELINNVD